MRASSTYIVLCVLLSELFVTFLSRQVVDGPNGNFTGFNDQNGDVAGMQFLYDQLSSRVPSRSFNVANWPNVSGRFAVSQRPMSHVVEGISRCQPCHVPGFPFTVALARGWWFQLGADTPWGSIHKSKSGRRCCRRGRKCRRF